MECSKTNLPGYIYISTEASFSLNNHHDASV